MKIVQIIPTLNSGGGEKFGVDLANTFAEDSNNDVVLIVISKINKNSLLYNKISKKVKLVSTNKNKGFEVKVAFRLFKILKSENPDIVHTHLRSLAYSFISNIMLKNKVVHTIHSLADKEANKYLRVIYGILFKYFNFTPIAISDKVLDSIVKTYRIKADLVYNGVPILMKSDKYTDVSVEIDSYKLTKNTIVMSYVGRLSPEKNQLMLIEAIYQLNKTGVDIILIIMGSKNIKNYANQCIKEIKDKPYIHYIGEKNNIADYLLLSDALCLSSIYEGLPLVILESMSIGLPVLTTPAGGVVDVVENGNNGLLTNGFQSTDFVSTAKIFLNNQYLFDKNKIIKKFESMYSIEKCCTNYMFIYDKSRKRIN